MHVERIQADAVDQFTTAKAIQFFHELPHARAAHKLKLTGTPHDPNVECDEDKQEGLNVCIC